MGPRKRIRNYQYKQRSKAAREAREKAFMEKLSNKRMNKINKLRENYAFVNGSLVEKFLEVSEHTGIIVHVMFVKDRGDFPETDDFIHSTQDHLLLCKDIETYKKYGKKFSPWVESYQKYDNDGNEQPIPWSHYNQVVEAHGAVRIKFIEEEFVEKVIEYYGVRCCIMTYISPSTFITLKWLNKINSLYLNSYYGPSHNAEVFF